MTSSPRVSVVIPCFNLGRYLPEAIASVRRQTFRDVEMIVVDDGSTDAETPAAIEAAGGPDLHAIRSENRGLSAARNLGISRARGEYVSCLDADDCFEPEWLERGVAHLEANPDVAFVSHWRRAFGDEERDWTPGRSDIGALLDQNVFNGAALFRRRLVDEVGGFDESMRAGCEDWEFWMRVTASGHRGDIIPEFLYRYRRRPESMSRTMNWLDPYGRFIDTHRDAYREHLLDLLLRREWTIARLCHAMDAARRDTATTLEPALAGRRRELELATARLFAPEGADHLAARVHALEHSWSWRITAPLRRIYGWIRR